MLEEVFQKIIEKEKKTPKSKKTILTLKLTDGSKLEEQLLDVYEKYLDELTRHALSKKKLCVLKPPRCGWIWRNKVQIMLQSKKCMEFVENYEHYELIQYR
jgi:hypothetical protein